MEFPTDTWLETIDEMMQTVLQVELDPAAAIAGEHLSTGGKRLRARLAMETGVRLGAEGKEMVPWAAACELLHNATLVHDDLQDGDRVRRGHPTMWVKHGAAQAINAGDLMLMPSCAVINAPQLPAPVRTGDLRETRDSCPLPRLTHVPATRLKT